MRLRLFIILLLFLWSALAWAEPMTIRAVSIHDPITPGDRPFSSTQS